MGGACEMKQKRYNQAQCKYCASRDVKRRVMINKAKKEYNIYLDCTCGESTHVYNWGYDEYTKTFCGFQYSYINFPKGLIVEALEQIDVEKYKDRIFFKHLNQRIVISKKMQFQRRGWDYAEREL